MSAQLGSKAGVAIRLALNLSDQLEGYVAEMKDPDLFNLREAAIDLDKVIAAEQKRRRAS